MTEEEFGKEGWRLFEKNSGRKVPRTSEVPDVIERYIDRAMRILPEKKLKTQELISSLISKDWAGISAKKVLEFYYS